MRRAVVVAVLLMGCDEPKRTPVSQDGVTKLAPPTAEQVAAAKNGPDCVAEGAQAATEVAVETQLVSPASAKYGPIEVMARDGQRIFTRVRVDSQNRMGAMLRGWWCASIQFEPCPTTKIHYSKLTGVLMCDEPPTAKQLQAVMALDGWPGVEMPAADKPKKKRRAKPATEDE